MLKESLHEHLRSKLSDADLQKWFDPLTVRASETGNVAVSFPHPLFSGWFDGEKRSLLEQALRAVGGPDVAVLFESPAYDGPGKEGARIRRPASDPSGNAFDSADKKACSFESFLYNKKNEFPLALARDVCESPPGGMHIPFVIGGKGVCGKTHLLRAMAFAMSENSMLVPAPAPSSAPSAPSPRAGENGVPRIFLGSTASLAALYETYGVSGLWELLYAHDALFLDDIQELGRHPLLVQEFIHMVDNCREKKKPLVLVVEDMAHASFPAKLRSRLEGGLFVDLKKPDMDVRLRHIRKAAKAASLSLSKEQMLTLAQQFHDIRLLNGIINKFSAFAMRRPGGSHGSAKEMGQLEFESVIANNGASQSRPLGPESIMHMVGERFGVSAKDISGSGRNQDMVMARQISMYLCRELLGLSFPAIGAAFGGKNHATVVYSHKKIQELRASDNNINKLVSALRKKCHNSAV